MGTSEIPRLKANMWSRKCGQRFLGLGHIRFFDIPFVHEIATKSSTSVDGGSQHTIHQRFWFMVILLSVLFTSYGNSFQATA